jgi:hypothetical protein
MNRLIEAYELAKKEKDYNAMAHIAMEIEKLGK